MHPEYCSSCGNRKQKIWPYISPVLYRLHWLPVCQRIENKFLLLTFKALMDWLSIPEQTFTLVQAEKVNLDHFHASANWAQAQRGWETVELWFACRLGDTESSRVSCSFGRKVLFQEPGSGDAWVTKWHCRRNWSLWWDRKVSHTRTNACS